MKQFRPILAVALVFGLLHSSVEPALAWTVPQPVDRRIVVTRGGPQARALPVEGKDAPNLSLPSAVVPAQKGKTAVAVPGLAPQTPDAEADPGASVVLDRMGTDISKAPASVDLGRYYDGEKPARDLADPVYADGAAADTPRLDGRSTLSVKARTAVPAPGREMGTGSPHTAVVPVIVIVAIVAAVAAAATGVWLWLRGKSKNDAWEQSKSNQDVIALEKARRDNDAEALSRMREEARGRQVRMQERVDHAKSAGAKKIETKEGKTISVKEAETFAAFDGLVAARSEMNENAVSQDPARRVGGETPAAWRQRLSGLEAEAGKTEFEGALAASLRSMRGELSRQDQAAAKYEKDIAAFDQTVPGLFGGRLKDMTARGRKDLEEYKAREIAPEKALFETVNGAMRGRVSDRLSARDAEYQKHLSRMQDLAQAAEGTLKSAVEMARKVDQDMTDMASHEKSRAFNLMMASQNENVLVDDYDSQGRKIGSHYEDHSATYKALAASAGAEARASAAGAQAGVKALNTIIPLLHKDPVLKAEGLTFALPSGSGTRVGSNGSVFFDFWLPASWNFFMTMFSESQANQARASFAPVKGGLESVLSEVGARRKAEAEWTGGKIDAVLAEQMAKVKTEKN